jgi:hypothetical protein
MDHKRHQHVIPLGESYTQTAAEFPEVNLQIHYNATRHRQLELQCGLIVLTVYPGAIAYSLLRAYVHLVVLSMPSIKTSVRISNHQLHNKSSSFSVALSFWLD